MTTTEATTEVFWTAFKSLPRARQRAIIQRIVEDKNLREDFMDLATIESRRGERGRPLREYLKQKSAGK